MPPPETARAVLRRVRARAALGELPAHLGVEQVRRTVASKTGGQLDEPVLRRRHEVHVAMRPRA